MSVAGSAGQSNSYFPMRPSLLTLFILLYSWNKQGLVDAARVNITIDDTDTSILYQPSESWHASSVYCPFCLNPDTNIALQNTYHDGTHIAPMSVSDRYAPSINPVASLHATTLARDANGERGIKVNIDRRTRRRNRNPTISPRTTKLDDVVSADPAVSAEFNFIGSAVYLYCIQPQGAAPANTTPTSMNLSFMLDDQPAGGYFHNGSTSASGFLPNVNIFAKDGLTNTPHVLRVNVGVDSVFLFDYMVYTRSEEHATHGVTAQIALRSSTPSSSEDESSKHHNAATFGGAVGGILGILAILASGVTFSIYRRRRRAANRDRHQRDRESLHTEASEDSPPMQGPPPFIPRYFPGTDPTAPPPYTPPATSLSYHPHSTFPSASLVTVHTPLPDPGPLSYADVPPSTPPPPEADITSTLPPEFGVAVPTPPLVTHTTIPLPPGIVAPEDEFAHNHHAAISEPGLQQSRSSSPLNPSPGSLNTAPEPLSSISQPLASDPHSEVAR